MKIAIIGGRGYIGKHLDYYLQQRGITSMVYDVHDFDGPNYKKIDMTNSASVADVDLNVDYIFMFAGLTGTYAGFDKYETYNAINEVGLLHLLDAIRKSDYRPKVIFPSTRLVYKGVDKALKESDEKETKTIYAVNKIACEGLLQAYMTSFEIPYTVFRICIPYGNLLSTEHIHVGGRVTLDILAGIQDKTNVLVHLCNLKGGQIPGKIYHYSATNKKILFILDGTEEEQRQLIEFFSPYHRYHFCKNTKGDILRAIAQMNNDKDTNNHRVNDFEPKNVVAMCL